MFRGLSVFMSFCMSQETIEEAIPMSVHVWADERIFGAPFLCKPFLGFCQERSQTRPTNKF